MLVKVRVAYRLLMRVSTLEIRSGILLGGKGTYLRFAGELSSPVREERLVTLRVLEMGGPMGESGANPLKGGG